MNGHMTSDGIRNVTDSPIFRAVAWAAAGLLQLVVALTVFSYRGSLDDIKKGQDAQGIRIGHLEDAVNAFATNQATVQLRLQQLENASMEHGKSIEDIRISSQQNTYNIDRLQEILKTQALNTRPPR